MEKVLPIVFRRFCQYSSHSILLKIFFKFGVDSRSLEFTRKKNRFNLTQCMYSKTCIKRPLKIDKTKVLMDNYSLMKVESIAECSKESILQYF